MANTYATFDGLRKGIAITPFLRSPMRMVVEGGEGGRQAPLTLPVSKDFGRRTEGHLLKGDQPIQRERQRN